MRTFKIINNATQKRIENIFPQLKDMDFEETEFINTKSICIFDHYLNNDEAISLLDNVSRDEKIRRIEIWNKFYENICSKFECYLVKYKKNKVLFKEPRSNHELLLRLINSDIYGYLMLAFPELEIIYEQYLDETHILYINNEAKAQIFLECAIKSGLNILER